MALLSAFETGIAVDTIGPDLPVRWILLSEVSSKKHNNNEKSTIADFNSCRRRFEGTLPPLELVLLGLVVADSVNVKLIFYLNKKYMHYPNCVLLYLDNIGATLKGFTDSAALGPALLFHILSCPFRLIHFLSKNLNMSLCKTQKPEIFRTK